MQLLAQTESGDAVYDTEVGGLGTAPHVFCYFGNRAGEYFCGGGGMNILSVEESTGEVLVT